MFLTAHEAAKFCRENGRPVSKTYLRRLRFKGKNDPGTHGPAWVRNPDNGYVMYSTDALLTWIVEWEKSLAPSVQSKPAHLAAA